MKSPAFCPTGWTGSIGPSTWSRGSHHLRAADFDGDGRPDRLAGLELAMGYIRIFRITGSPPPG
jgi:hypothetical protein